MEPRVKKLIGLGLMLPYLVIYIVLAVMAADWLPDHWAIDLAYFAVAGTAWAFPLKRLMNWMAAPPPAPGAGKGGSASTLP
ncbi:MAG: DUF2842 domain-containing protein [Alphaproteobacteria bacterium]|nr:DUF2842 domain-containing protein [Alphaproteobacteria bacterium]